MGRKKQPIIFIAILFVGLVFSYCWFYFQNEKKFWVRFLDIGQGDSALINFGNGEQMLVDCGADRTVLFRLGAALPLWDRTIDYLVATHPDRDHYGGCTDVLKRYRVKHIILNGHGKEYDPLWREFAAAAEAEQAETTVINGFLRLPVASSTLEFLSPDDSLSLALSEADSNNYSVVFKLTSPVGKTFLFTGDAEEPLEEAVLKKYCVATARPLPSLPLKGEGATMSPPFKEGIEGGSGVACRALQADILKVGHHGSPGASSEEFLQAVRPEIAVISSGKGNRYGHPSPRVLKRLERVGARVLRTDLLGDIVLP